MIYDYDYGYFKSTNNQYRNSCNARIYEYEVYKDITLNNNASIYYRD